MAKISTELRWPHVLRSRSKKITRAGKLADEKLEKLFFKRLGRLTDVRRFVVGWIGLIILLAMGLFLQVDHMRDKYQSLLPAPGGVYTEGIVGNYSNSNPLYATSAPDVAVSKLVFAALFQYDGQGELTPQLAQDIKVDITERIYTVTLKPDLRWHDGEDLTSEDVAFTFETAQNPDTGSHLQPSWQGVEIEARDARTIVFTLPYRLSGFAHSLTTGLLPKHILGSVDPGQLRSSDFNTVHPIGAGPFRFEAVEQEVAAPEGQEPQESIGLAAFENYVLGKPSISKFIVRTFASQQDLEAAYSRKEISSMAGTPTMPDSLKDDSKTDDISLSISGQVMAFFKTTAKPLDSKEVRKALVLGADRGEVISSVGYPLTASDSPLLKSHIGYNQKMTQKTGNKQAAEKILGKAGWKMDSSEGIRKKGKQALRFTLHAEANSEYASVAQSLQRQWREIGADVQVHLQSAQDLQSTIATHNYDALITAISTGADPDVYAYWHSSQADIQSGPKLNLSEYRSKTADIALEGGRSRTGAKIRAAKYKPFLQAWIRDNPALALYQPRYLYVVREPFYGLDMDLLVTPVDRFANVEDWMIRQERR